MCEFKSGIILKNKIVLAPRNNESHSDLLQELGIDDNYSNASRVFVRAELTPPDNNKGSDISKWVYKVDQDIVPDWYKIDPDKYEQDFRYAVAEYVNRTYIRMCGHAWEAIKTTENETYYLMADCYERGFKFGSNNNYATSFIRELLNNSGLAIRLKEEFGDRLVPIDLDLLSLDGLSDYGTASGDILAIPTLDLYRSCRKNISNADTWWWLATPYSTPSGCGSGYVECVHSCGGVDWDGCGGRYAVRPFFILKS